MGQAYFKTDKISVESSDEKGQIYQQKKEKKERKGRDVITTAISFQRLIFFCCVIKMPSALVFGIKTGCVQNDGVYLCRQYQSYAARLSFPFDEAGC